MDDYTELYHHGVKGQKWGVRRYQNTDGSLTDEGYRHYGYGRGAGTLGAAIGERAASGFKTGAKVGVGVGAVAAGIGVGTLAATGLMAPAGLVAIGASYFTAGVAAGAWDGMRLGAILGAVDYNKGRKYIEKHQDELNDFLARDLNRNA